MTSTISLPLEIWNLNVNQILLSIYLSIINLVMAHIGIKNRKWERIELDRL